MASLNQGRVEELIIEAIHASYPPPAAPFYNEPEPIRVERMVFPTSLVIDESAVDDEDAYPVTVTLRHATEDEATPTPRLGNLNSGMMKSNLWGDGVEELIPRSRRSEAEDEVLRCKYVVGCDGAHSWTRKMLGEGFEMVGDMTNYIW